MATTPTREVARRVFAGEFNDASYTFKESDDERAPVYVLLPTGERANRVFVVGTLMETEDVGNDSEYWQGQVIDPNGDRFFMYAGQYQPDAASMLRELEPPAYVAVVGKPRTYETDEGDVNVSIRPESISEVDAATRDRWVVETAERTLERVQAFQADAADDPDDGATVDEYVAMAREEYDLPVENYRRQVVEALESLEADDAIQDGDDAGADDGSGGADGDAGDAGGDDEDTADGDTADTDAAEGATDGSDAEDGVEASPVE